LAHFLFLAGISKFHGTILYELALTKAAILAQKLEDLCKSIEPEKKQYLHQMGKVKEFLHISH